MDKRDATARQAQMIGRPDITKIIDARVLNSKPSIVDVVGRYVPLRKAGKEYLGRCPFHDDKHPSFSVSEEKQVFHCFGCGESGDVVHFIMKHDGLTFPEALRELGMDCARSRAPQRDDPRRRAAERVVCWVNLQRARLNERIRELDEDIGLAEELDDAELAESFWRERRIVADLRDDLARVEYLPSFLELKESIERIAGGDLWT
jgi:DNA primase catalytic core